MKHSRKNVRTKATAIPQLRFEDQRLTAFAGLVVIQEFFQLISFKLRLLACFRHQTQGKIFERATLFMQLVIHLLLGDGRRLQQEEKGIPQLLPVVLHRGSNRTGAYLPASSWQRA